MNKSFLTVAQVFAIIYGVILLFFIWLIIPGILAYFNFKAAGIMDKAKRGEATREQVTNYSIYLIFTTLIGGIFGLLAGSGQGEHNNVAVLSIEQKLQELDKLFDKGIISKEEYDQRRKRIIDTI
jgi:Na+-driven multidrug efflux pump